MRKKITFSVAEAVLATQQLQKPEAIHFIDKTAQVLASCYSQGGKLLVAGNGGSLCDATHFAEELTGIFRKKRKALPAIAINDHGLLTCVSNDIGYEYVFSRAIEAYGLPGDCFVGLTTSGNSENLVQAFKTAKTRGLKTIALLGRGGGKLKGVADLEWIVEGFKTSDRIQEAHMAAIHIIVEMVEEHLFYQDAAACEEELVALLSR